MTAIPKGFSTVTPHLVVDGADAAIALYQKALNAELCGHLAGPDGKVVHAMLQIGTSRIFISDPMADMPRKPPAGGGLSSVAFYLYVEDVDAAYHQAVECGMIAAGEGPEDMFWGDRTGVVTDGFGHNWTFASHLRDVSPEEMSEIIKEMTK